MRHGRCAGFTLLEVLVAVMLTALLTTALFQVYREIQQAQRRRLDAGGRSRIAVVLLDRLERELLGTLLLTGGGSAEEGEEQRSEHPWVFLGADRVLDAQDADALKFITRSPARSPGSHAQGGLRLVTYAAEEDPEQGELALYRQEEQLPEGLEKELGVAREGQAVVHDMSRFSLRYLDEQTGEWVDAWDSSEESRLDRLPRSVEITVQLLLKDEAGELSPGEEFQRVVTLPVRPIDPNAPGQTGAADCGEGDTVAACMARTGPGSSPAEKHEYQQLLDLYGQRCFADIAGTPAEDELMDRAGIATEDCE
jgi:type II secretion system protein J